MFGVYTGNFNSQVESTLTFALILWAFSSISVEISVEKFVDILWTKCLHSGIDQELIIVAIVEIETVRLAGSLWKTQPKYRKKVLQFFSRSAKKEKRGRLESDSDGLSFCFGFLSRFGLVV